MTTPWRLQPCSRKKAKRRRSKRGGFRGRRDLFRFGFAFGVYTPPGILCDYQSTGLSDRAVCNGLILIGMCFAWLCDCFSKCCCRLSLHFASSGGLEFGSHSFVVLSESLARVWEFVCDLNPALSETAATGCLPAMVTAPRYIPSEIKRLLKLNCTWETVLRSFTGHESYHGFSGRR
jgi:hypothetical protein